MWLQLFSWLLLWPPPLLFWALTRPRRTGPLLLALASATAWVAVPAYAAQQRSERHGEDPGVTSTPTRPAAAATTSATKPTTRPGPDGKADPLVRLRVASEGPRTGYRRDLFPHWVDADHDRCDTREEVLIAKSRTSAQLDPYNCKVITGDWLSVYDGISTDDPADLQIDHVVALAEAWDSGAASWDTSRCRAFANDLDEPGALIAVTGSSNQAKSDHDPAEWRPPRHDAWCAFATDWVTVKVKWDLTADEREMAALREILASC